MMLRGLLGGLLKGLLRSLLGSLSEGYQDWHPDTLFMLTLWANCRDGRDANL